ncbi:hypothetical protein WG899_17105 [Paucibacter sp. AS339]|uniref:hypothetical protein n=1 Tax=Paucibacter hankyongi TaxID=3133434 RepID=UPI00309FA820
MERDEIQRLIEILELPKSGPIDFKHLLDGSFNDALTRFRKGHFPMRKKVVHQISFDEPFVSTSSAASMVIDTLYKADQGVEFLPCLHTYDWATQVSGFEPMEPRPVYSDPTSWEVPHVFAVHDSASPQFRFSTSQPNSLNVGYGGGSSLSQLMTNRYAVRINFERPACAVQIQSDYRIHHEDQGKPIHNWPQMLAYSADGTLLDQDDAPYGGMLCVSSWADDIAYVMVTVNNHYAGVEPFGIFDNLSWTTIEFVLRYVQKLRQAPKPVPRGALIDQVGHRLSEIQTTQRRLQRHLAKLDDAELASQLRADLAELQQQTESLQRFYSAATHDTANAPAHRPA